MKEVHLPAILPQTTPALEALTTALDIPRDVLNSDDEIQAAWSNLPRVLKTIPPDLRDQGIARMCVAVAVGLFDSAVNYVWNSSIIELRHKVRKFGLPVVEQIISKDFDEEKLVDLKDSELLGMPLG